MTDADRSGVRHGEGKPVPLADAPADDPALALVYADWRIYLELERANCTCEALCTCGWSERLGLA